VRLHCKWSQRQLAVTAGIPRSYIHRVEHGQVTPGIENLVRIAEAFEIEPYKLLKLICKMRRQLESPTPEVTA
jgi:transcriptional regulator with XRE-family HTH domain